MRRIAVALLSLAAAAPAMAGDEHSIRYWEARPAERRAKLAECHNSPALADTYACRAAEAAATRQLGKPLPPLPSLPEALPPALPTRRTT